MRLKDATASVPLRNALSLAAPYPHSVFSVLRLEGGPLLAMRRP
jgi:hypothetical protein